MPAIRDDSKSRAFSIPAVAVSLVSTTTCFVLSSTCCTGFPFSSFLLASGASGSSFPGACPELCGGGVGAASVPCPQTRLEPITTSKHTKAQQPCSQPPAILISIPPHILSAPSAAFLSDLCDRSCSWLYTTLSS